MRHTTLGESGVTIFACSAHFRRPSGPRAPRSIARIGFSDSPSSATINRKAYSPRSLSNTFVALKTLTLRTIAGGWTFASVLRANIKSSRYLEFDAPEFMFWNSTSDLSLTRHSTPESLAASDKMDPVLEIWIDDKTSPTTVRFQGLLDSTTRQPLLSLMSELLRNGLRNFIIDIEGASVCEPGGLELLALCQRKVCDAGGTVDWHGTTCRQGQTDFAGCESSGQVANSNS